MKRKKNPELQAVSEHARELFAPLGEIRIKPMFGGAGIYLEDTFFALIYEYEIYIKADAAKADCVLTGNSAGYYGGGGTYGSTLNNCTLTGNYAGSGGAVSQCTVSNSALTGNSAAGAGGGASSCSLYNCTVAGNAAQNWRLTGFVEANDPVAWQTGVASIGYGDGDDATVLASMLHATARFRS